jgi:ribosomal-protein-alanine N-acetyltransferase
MTNSIELHTPRLLLKGITPALINELFKIKSKEELLLFFNVDESAYNRLKEMNKAGMESFRVSLFYFLLVDKTSGKVIGECGFHSWNKAHHRAELYYHLRSDSDKRKGFMTEAVKEVLHFGYNRMQLHRVQALVADDNVPSIKLLERFKFTKEGTLREDYLVDGKMEDSECYSLLKNEWELTK